MWPLKNDEFWKVSNLLLQALVFGSVSFDSVQPLRSPDCLVRKRSILEASGAFFFGGIPPIKSNKLSLTSRDNKMTPDQQDCYHSFSIWVEKWPRLFGGMLVSQMTRICQRHFCHFILTAIQTSFISNHNYHDLCWLSLKNNGTGTILRYTPMSQLALLKWTSLQKSYHRWHVMISTQTTSPLCHWRFLRSKNSTYPPWN